MIKGKSVLIDRQNFDVSQRYTWVEIGHSYGVEVVALVFRTPKDVRFTDILPCICLDLGSVDLRKQAQTSPKSRDSQDARARLADFGFDVFYFRAADSS